ncbi:MAG: TolC family protein [Candidatus Eisenbacteria bacterium]|nr:TolC family protein [Candidatus Eisenbacteria bacterium]
MRRALEQGEEMRAARARVREAGGRVREAASGAFPQLTGSLTYTRQLQSIYADAGADTGITNLFKNSPFGAANSWNAELHAEQLLFAGGKVGAGIKAARSYRHAARENERESASEVTFQVKRAYLDAALARRVLAIAEGGLTLAREQLKQVRMFRKQGTRSEYDLLRAQVDAANQEPPVVSARNTFDLALLELKRLTNVPAAQPLELTTALEPDSASVPVPAPDSLGFETRPALVAAGENVTVQEQAVRAAIAGRWPELSASATLSNLAFPQSVAPSSTGDFKRNWSASVKLSFPLFLGFRTEGAAERARAQVQEAEAERDRLRESVRIEVEQARLELEHARSALAARREAVRWARRAHELAGIRYGSGMATQLDVSDARLQMQTAQMQQVQVTRDYLVALAQLERALGRPVAVVWRSLESLEDKTGEEGQ